MTAINQRQCGIAGRVDRNRVDMLKAALSSAGHTISASKSMRLIKEYDRLAPPISLLEFAIRRIVHNTMGDRASLRLERKIQRQHAELMRGEIGHDDIGIGAAVRHDEAHIREVMSEFHTTT